MRFLEAGRQCSGLHCRPRIWESPLGTAQAAPTQRVADADLAPSFTLILLHFRACRQVYPQMQESSLMLVSPWPSVANRSPSPWSLSVSYLYLLSHPRCPGLRYRLSGQSRNRSCTVTTSGLSVRQPALDPQPCTCQSPAGLLRLLLER